MGIEILAAAAIAVAVAQMVGQAMAADAAADAAAEQADAQIQELERQAEEENRIAAEKKADRVREADKALASMVNSLGASGGLATANESRFAAEIGGHEGFDLARIEGNRASANQARVAEGTAIRRDARAARTQANFAILGAGLEFGATAVGTQQGLERDRQLIQQSKTGTNTQS